MSDFLRKLKVKTDAWDEAEKGVEHLKESHPTVFGILAGQRPKGDDPGVLPGSIRLFSNGGTLKFVLSGKEWLFDVYGILGNQLTIFDTIEAEVKADHVSYKVVSERKDPKTPY